MNTTTHPTEPPQLFEGLRSDEDCVSRLDHLWPLADCHPHYPCGTATAVELLRANGNDVTAELIEAWATRGMIPSVQQRDGCFAWGPRDIYAAVTSADLWRRWLPCAKHVHRMSAVELAELQANAAGSTAFSDLAVFDCCAYVELLARTADPDVRRTLATALKTRLRQLEVLDK